MKQIGNLNYQFKQNKKAPPHEISAMSELIREHIGFTEKYGRGFWMRHIKNSGITYNRLDTIVKEAVGLPNKYNKGGYIVNKLKDYGSSKK